jgi:hypothetical protein
MLVVDDFDRNRAAAAEFVPSGLLTAGLFVWMSNAQGLRVMRSFLC